MIAIHEHKKGFHKGWIQYFDSEAIPYKLVNCYSSSILSDLGDCKALLWHHNHSDERDILFAKQLLFALEHAGIQVFPNFNTGWFFDDKIAQKYLLEAIGAPMIKSYVFYTKIEALNWIESQDFPKVFKLRGGAGSSNVKLVHNRKSARSLTRTAFGKGFSSFDPLAHWKDTLRAVRQGKKPKFDLLKALARFIIYPKFALVAGRERGYVYFQEFIPNNQFDIRIIVIGDKAFGLKRFVREGDFRASGSGKFAYEREEFDTRCIQIAFEVNEKLNSQCIAYDFVFDSQNTPLIIEISFGYTPAGYLCCPGYWDKNLKWHEGKITSESWMIQEVIKSQSST